MSNHRSLRSSPPALSNDSPPPSGSNRSVVNSLGSTHNGSIDDSSSLVTFNDTDIDVATYVPTKLIKATDNSAFLESVAVGEDIRFASLRAPKVVEWAQFYRHSFSVLHNEHSRLRQKVHNYEEMARKKERLELMTKFAKSAEPIIKKAIFNIFAKTIFPSIKEVTTTTSDSLKNLELTHQSPFGVACLDKIFKSAQPTTIDLGPQSVHPYDNEKDRDTLWMTLGVGVMSVRHLGTCRNTYTNTLRDAISESFCYVFFLFTLCPISPFCHFLYLPISRGNVYYHPSYVSRL